MYDIMSIFQFYFYSYQSIVEGAIFEFTVRVLFIFIIVIIYSLRDKSSACFFLQSFQFYRVCVLCVCVCVCVYNV